MAVTIRDIQDYKNFKPVWNLFGKNPVNALNRIGGVLYGDRVIDQLNFGNELEPSRQASIRRLLGMLQPGGEQGMIDAFANQSLSQGRRSAKRQAAAARDSGDASEYDSILANVDNLAQREVNNYSANLMGYEGLMGREQSLLNAILMGQDPTGLMNVSQLASNGENIAASINNRMAQDRANSFGGQLSGLINAGAQLYGMGAFGGGVNRAAVPARTPISLPVSYGGGAQMGYGGYTLPVTYGVR